MKGIRLVLVRILLCIASALNAQRKNHFAIHVAPQYGIDENIDYNADLSLMYIRDIGRLFNLGAEARNPRNASVTFA